MIARTGLPRRAVMHSWRHGLRRTGMSYLPRPVVLFTLIGLVASIALSASVMPLASAASTGTFVGLSPARLLDTRPGASPIPST